MRKPGSVPLVLTGTLLGTLVDPDGVACLHIPIYSKDLWHIAFCKRLWLYDQQYNIYIIPRVVACSFKDRLSHIFYRRTSIDLLANDQRNKIKL